MQFVREASGGILGVDTTSVAPWIDDYYLLQLDEIGTVEHRGPFTVTGGWCDLSPDQGRLFCFDGNGASVVNIATSEVVTVQSIGVRTSCTPTRYLRTALR